MLIPEKGNWKRPIRPLYFHSWFIFDVHCRLFHGFYGLHLLQSCNRETLQDETNFESAEGMSWARTCTLSQTLMTHYNRLNFTIKWSISGVLGSSAFPHPKWGRFRTSYKRITTSGASQTPTLLVSWNFVGIQPSYDTSSHLFLLETRVRTTFFPNESHVTYLVKVFIFASTALWRKQILVKAVPISFVAPRNKREKKALENAFYVEIYCVMYNEIQISTKLKIEDMENDSRVYWVNYIIWIFSAW